MFRKLSTVTAAAALLAAVGFSGTAWAGPGADVVDSLIIPTEADVSGDDGDGGADALFETDCPNNCDGGDSDKFTSIGWTDDNNGGDPGGDPEGGVLIMSYTDNVCLDLAGADLIVFEQGAPELFDVETAFGAGVFSDATVGTFTANDPVTSVNSTEFESEGGAFNKVRITATNMAGSSIFSGAEIDAVECLNSFDAADITKDFSTHGTDPDPDEINQTSKGGFDEPQYKAFEITITNNTGADGGLSGLTIIDVVPAEFDLDGIGESDDVGTDGILDGVQVVAGDCTATGTEGGAKGKGKGNQKLAPEIITIDAGGLDDGDSCTIKVWVTTDSDKPGNGPNWTPSACPVTLNDGVKIFDSSMNLLLQDDDTLIFDDGNPATEGFCNEPAED